MNNLQLKDLKQQLVESLTIQQMEEVRAYLAAAIQQQKTSNYLSKKLSHARNL